MKLYVLPLVCGKTLVDFIDLYILMCRRLRPGLWPLCYLVLSCRPGKGPRATIASNIALCSADDADR